MADAVGGLRLTLSSDTTGADVDAVLDVLPRVVAQLRPLAATH
jgi:cysteine sulfinate desulfinase/cysteine desulfurase-like protein